MFYWLILFVKITFAIYIVYLVALKRLFALILIVHYYFSKAHLLKKLIYLISHCFKGVLNINLLHSYNK